MSDRGPEGLIVDDCTSARGMRQGEALGLGSARIIHDGSSRNRAVAMRDRRAEP